jgi:hypothetical protein
MRTHLRQDAPQLISSFADVAVLRPRATWNWGQVRKEVLISLSLANLALLRVWSELLTTKSANGYTLRHPPRPVDLEAAMLDVCLLAALFWAISFIGRRSALGRGTLQWGVVLALALPLNALRQVLANSGIGSFGGQTFRHAGGSLVVVAGVAGICLAIGALAGWRDRMARVVSAVLLVSSP